MTFSVTMPALGESVSEGTVTRWLKAEGDHVNVDEPLLEVSTDKVDTEIPSPVSGTLQKIVVQVDQTVPVGAELAIIADGASASAPAPAAAPKADNLITIKSPMIGTFYRTPGPDKDAFVNVGDSVQPGMKLCIIEAMKTFNEIESEVSGKIVKVLVDNASPVDYDQPLFLVDPA